MLRTSSPLQASFRPFEATARHQKQFLAAVSLSKFGDGLTDIALMTLAFSLSNSASLVILVAALKIFGSFFASLIVPGLLRTGHNRILVYRSLDILRAALIVLPIFTGNIWVLLALCVPIFTLEAISLSLSASILQNIASDRDRLALNARFQYMTFAGDLLGRGLGAALLLAAPLQLIFALDAVTFLASALLLAKMPALMLSSTGKKPAEFYAYVFKDRVQQSIIFLRLCALTTLSVFWLLVTYRMTELASLLTGTPLVGAISFTDANQAFSTLYACFTILVSVTTVLGAMAAPKLATTAPLAVQSYFAILACALGLWLLAPTGEAPASFVIYCIGGILSALGTVILRLFIQTSGQILTPKQMLSEVIATADSMSRMWQNACAGFAVLALSINAPLPLIAAASAVTIAGVIPSFRLGARLRSLPT
ncbi:hypothetical protein JM93_00968 [Roseibium hamelinense]|uniref:MFS transporter n=1 Tax=Roseibium hamelinense TaxID=150831 RepID=A0A562TIB4_9HYPH|nr:MFS transporter [Roseibium hamelinense]MTI42765.1 hypothetical protein [Roseibium hamelinense]TWI93411.1 hypothetical protein JM93_00968 [Roseibium hamelinense]